MQSPLDIDRLVKFFVVISRVRFFVCFFFPKGLITSRVRADDVPCLSLLIVEKAFIKIVIA